MYMGILRNLRSYFSLNNPNTTINAQSLEALSPLGYNTTEVTVLNVLGIPAVSRCLKLIGQTISALPIDIQGQNENGIYKLDSHPMLEALKEPNSFSPQGDFFEAVIIHLLLRGNAIIEIDRRRDRSVKGFYILDPDEVSIEVTTKRNLVYKIRDRVIRDYDILHFKDHTLDGIAGLDKLKLHKDLWGLALENISYAVKYYSNGARPSGVLKTPEVLSDQAYNRLRTSWETRYGGANKGKTAILEGGMSYESIGANPDEASFSNTTNLVQQQVAQVFGVPLYLLGDMSKMTFNNTEQLAIQYVKYTILPVVETIAQELTRKLLTEEEKTTGLVFNFDLNSLLKADTQNRAEYLSKLINAGVLSINDARRIENLPDIDGGDNHFLQVNMMEINKLVSSEQPQEEERQARSYSDYPQSVSNNAKRGIELDEKVAGKCDNAIGRKRASQLVNRESLSFDTIKRMFSYLSRAEEYYDPSDPEACGTISYLLWGGKSAKTWAERKIKQIENERKEDI